MGERLKNWVGNVAMILPRSIGTLGMLVNDTSNTLFFALKDISTIGLNYTKKSKELFYEDLKSLKEEGNLKRYHVGGNLLTRVGITGTGSAELITALTVNGGINGLKTVTNAATNLFKILRYSIFNTKPVSKTAISYDSIKIIGKSKPFKIDTSEPILDWFLSWLRGESLGYMTKEKEEYYKTKKTEREKKKGKKKGKKKEGDDDSGTSGP